MGVLDSSYKKAQGVKSPGLKKIFFVFRDTLLSKCNACMPAHQRKVKRDVSQTTDCSDEAVESLFALDVYKLFLLASV